MPDPRPSTASSSRPGEDWSDLCAASEVPREGGLYIERGNRPIAVFRLPAEPASDDEQSPPSVQAVQVMDDTCPHAGGSLSAGHIQDGCIICPWHAWPFDVRSGACPDNATFRVRIYESRVENGRVMARL